MAKRSLAERKIPTPLVLALASAMVSVGVVAWLIATGAVGDDGEAADLPDAGDRVRIDTRTAEAAAESFLDAWRKRQFDVAQTISRGTAHGAVLAKMEEDARLEPEVAELRAVWDRMADSRLDLRVNESEDLGGGKLALRGVAEGQFLKQPYRRLMEFVLVRERGKWFVEDMRLGEILTPIPSAEPEDAGTGGARRDPADIPMREPR